MKSMKRLGYGLFLYGLIHLVGCQSTKTLPKSDFHFFLERQNATQEEIWSPMAIMPISQLKINICPYPVWSAGGVEFAKVTASNLGKCILFKLNRQATIELYKLSIECTGQKIVFVFNGETLGLSAPIHQAITDGILTIFPEIEEDRLDTIVVDINDTVIKLKKLKEM